MGSVCCIPPLATYSFSEYRPPGAERLDAPHAERNFMPSGMLPRQNDIKSPKERVSIPAACKCAEMERPYGPAPITVIRQTGFGARVFSPAPAVCVVVIVEPIASGIMIEQYRRAAQ